MKDIIIIGGGLAGLISAIELSRAGLAVLLIEKKKYPFHKVCGEYISNEVLPYLNSLGIDPFDLGASRINNFLLSAPSGKFLKTNLDLGGFGLSRYHLDSCLVEIAGQSGCEIWTEKEVETISFNNDVFQIMLPNGTTRDAKYVIGAYGKRTKLDKDLGRDFITKRSPYIGVKYHIKTDFASDLIALHNFKDGYCGISKVENETFNLCYLTHRNNLREFGNIKEMEENVLYKNPFLRKIFTNSQFLFSKPEVINEISFEKKSLVDKHILMVGDSAGMITPLCGNGMSMAIHGAKILSTILIEATNKSWPRDKVEKKYFTDWNKQFSVRLAIGRNIQRMFGREVLSEVMIDIFKKSGSLTRFAIKQTHGQPF